MMIGPDDPPKPKAALTLGKDMTFRDYAQGAFRMRGIATGQTIHLILIPEVNELLRRELRAAQMEELAMIPSGEVLRDASILTAITAWLVTSKP